MTGQSNIECFTYVVMPVVTDCVELQPGANYQQVVDANPENTCFRFMNGIHFVENLKPRTGQRFIKESATAVLDGSIVVTGWQQDPLTQQWFAQSPCALFEESTYDDDKNFIGGSYTGNNSSTTSGWPNDLYFDGQPGQQGFTINTAGQIGPFTAPWYHLDAAANRIWIGRDDPSGTEIRISCSAHAFLCACNGQEAPGAGPANVELDALIIQRYATPYQHGAVHIPSSENWSITNCQIEYSHDYAIKKGNNTSVVGGNLSWNGRGGIHGEQCTPGCNYTDRLTGLRVNDVLFEFNGWAGGDTDWDGGAAKLSRCDDSQFTNCVVRHNWSHGFWWDIGCVGFEASSNQFIENYRRSLFAEISTLGILNDNNMDFNNQHFNVVGHPILHGTFKHFELSYNPLGLDNLLGQKLPWGADILLSNTGFTEVLRNDVDADYGGTFFMADVSNRKYGPGFCFDVGTGICQIPADWWFPNTAGGTEARSQSNIIGGTAASGNRNTFRQHAQPQTQFHSGGWPDIPYSGMYGNQAAFEGRNECGDVTSASYDILNANNVMENDWFFETSIGTQTSWIFQVDTSTTGNTAYCPDPACFNPWSNQSHDTGPMTPFN